MGSRDPHQLLKKIEVGCWWVACQVKSSFDENINLMRIVMSILSIPWTFSTTSVKTYKIEWLIFAISCLHAFASSGEWRQIKISNRSLVLSAKNIRDVMGDTIKQLALTSLAQPQLH